MVKKRFFVAIAFSAFLLYIGLATIIGDIFNNNISVEGTLKKYNDDTAVVEYFVNGEKKWYRMYGARSYEDGEKVLIEYEQDNIENVYLGDESGIGLIIFIFVLCSILFFPAICDGIVYYNIPKKGTKIEVEYVETTNIFNSSVNYYEMKFKWVNPENNEVHYLVNTDFVDFDPKDILKEKNITKFTAYINLKKPSQYRVMLDNLLEGVHLNKEKITMM